MANSFPTTKNTWVANDLIESAWANSIEDVLGITGAHNFSRAATFIVAANDSTAQGKATADYICDGTADDVQIQAAFDALPSTGGSVMLLDGKFNIAAALWIPAATKLFGQGYNTHLFLVAGTDDHMLKNENFGNAGSRDSNIVVYGIRFDHNKANNSAGAVISFNETQYCKFLNNWFIDADFTLDGSDSAIVKNNYSINSRGIGITIGAGGEDPVPPGTGSIDCLVEGNTVINSGDDGIYIDLNSLRSMVKNNNVISAGRYGIIVDNNCTEIQVDGNVIRSSTSISILVTYACHRTSVTNNKIISAGNDGIQFQNNSDYGVISHNTIKSPTNDGIQVGANHIYMSITDNTIQLANDHGIIIHNDCDYSKINDNTIIDSGQRTDATYRDIYVNGAEYCSVVGNICRATQANKVVNNINSDNSSNFLTVIGNVAEGATATEIDLTGANNESANNI